MDAEEGEKSRHAYVTFPRSMCQVSMSSTKSHSPIGTSTEKISIDLLIRYPSLTFFFTFLLRGDENDVRVEPSNALMSLFSDFITASSYQESIPSVLYHVCILIIPIIHTWLFYVEVTYFKMFDVVFVLSDSATSHKFL